MRPFLRPAVEGVFSRRWAFGVNTVAASPLVTEATRHAILRRSGLELGDVRILPRCHFHSADIRMDDGAILNHGVHIENVGRVEIGAATGLGIFTTVLTSNHELGSSRARLGAWFIEPVTIGAGCWIGARVLILPGVTIGDGCVVAAGALIRQDCAPNGVYAGVPARRVKDLPP